MKKKYSLITDEQINDGIKEGRFTKDQVGVIRDEKQRFVKFLKEDERVESPIPRTLIQVNQNIIYQADLQPIFDAILEVKNLQIFNELEELFQVVLDKLLYYKDHRERLDELNSKALEALSVFDQRITRYIDGIDTKNLSSISDDHHKFFGALKSYLNLSFVYIITVFWLHREKLHRDRNALGKLNKLEDGLRQIYNLILIDKAGKTELLLKDSVYAYLFLNGGEKIHLIEKLVKHDSRCKNGPMDFFESYREDCIRPDQFNSTFSVDAPQGTIEARLEFALKLYEVFEIIGYLRDVFNELIKVGNLNFDEVEIVEGQVHNRLPLTVIPLALVKGKSV